MSWSVHAQGRAGAVAPYLEKEFEKIVYLNGEEKELFEAASKLIVKAVRSFPDNAGLLVTAGGSASDDHSSSPPKRTQCINISISPVYGLIV